MEMKRSIITKFLKHFYLEYESDTAEDYLDSPSITSNQTKYKSGGYCSITGMPLKYGQSVSFEDALRSFMRSLTDEERAMVSTKSESEEYADVEEHDTEREETKLTLYFK
jgi:hypothetical protein